MGDPVTVLFNLVDDSKNVQLAFLHCKVENATRTMKNTVKWKTDILKNVKWKKPAFKSVKL